MILLIILAVILSVADFFLLTKYLKFEVNKKFYLIYVIKILINAGTTVLMIMKYNSAVYSYLMMVFISMLSLIAAEDAVSMKIDKYISLLLLLLGLITSFFVPGGVFWKIIVFGAVIALVMYLFYKKSKDSVGMGDVICISASSLCFTFSNVFSLMIYTLFTCLIFGLIQLVFKKINAKQGIPFIPFLVLGIILNLILI